MATYRTSLPYRHGRPVKPASHRPNMVGRGLIAAGGILLISASVWLAVTGWQQITQARYWPIATVVIQGDVTPGCRQRIETVVTQYAVNGLWRLPMHTLDRHLETLPWIETARVRRVWPDRLRIAVTSRSAVARWGGAAALTASGEIFAPPLTELPDPLPLLAGPPGSAEQVLGQYQILAPRLKQIGLRLDMLTMDRRMAWHLYLANDIVVELGRTDIMTRFERFIKAYPSIIAPTDRRIARIDLRYSNGLAVAWQPFSPPSPMQRNQPYDTQTQ